MTAEEMAKVENSSALDLVGMSARRKSHGLYQLRVRNLG
jgi:hypothetical protein